MPKTKTKTTFTATLTAKIGKTPITLLVPIDLAVMAQDDVDTVIHEIKTAASVQLDDLVRNIKYVIKNSKDLRIAYKAVVKAANTPD
jgi:hypothetical protein